MKRTFTLGLSGILLTSLIGAGCSKNDEAKPSVQSATPVVNSTIATAELANPSQFPRINNALVFSYYDLAIEANTPVSATFEGAEVATQHVDTDGDGSKDSVQVAVELAPAQRGTLVLSNTKSEKQWPALTQAEISHKQGGEWVPHPKVDGAKAYEGGTFVNVTELTPPDYYTDHSNWIRYEGPGIESDKVGYRIYLDWRNGFDIFGKSVSTPVLQNVGQDGYESYHHLADWGMDILKVGSSLGAGGYGFWNGESVELVAKADSRTAKIIENGPLRSALSIDYKNWKINNTQTDLHALFSMNAGSRLVKTELTLSENLPNIAVGVVKHKETELILGNTDIPGDAYSYIASWGKQSLNGDHLGMAVFFRNKDLNKTTQDKSSYIAVLEPIRGDLDYYFAAAWEGEHGAGIKTKEAFIEYLEQEAEMLTQKTRVNLDTTYSQKHKPATNTADTALAWAVQFADSELERKTLGYEHDGWDVNRQRPPKFEYDIVGILPMAYAQLSEVTGEERHRTVPHKVTATYINDDGSIKRYKLSNYNIDAVSPGVSVLYLYDDTKEEKFKLAADLLRSQLATQPRTSEGAFWHKKKYDSQLWLDGVFMGMPFLAEYTTKFEHGEALEEVVKEFELSRKYLRDEKTGLYYHGWDEKKQQVWANPETGLSPEFWGRGMGWFAMATLDVLDFIPEDQPELRQPILNIIKELAVDLQKVQDPATGTWWQVMDKPNAPGNYREASASAMFTYFYAKAIRKGYLPKDYLATAQKAYDGLINEFVLVHKDGKISVTNQCYVAGLGFGRDGSYNYYMSERVAENDPKSSFSFILAGLEMHRLLSNK